MNQISTKLFASLFFMSLGGSALGDQPADNHSQGGLGQGGLVLAQAQTESTEGAQRTVKFERLTIDSSKLAPEVIVDINNQWGDVRLRNHRDGFVRIEAAIQRIGANAPTPELIPVEDEKQFSLNVKVEGGVLEPRNNRVDLVIYAPNNMTVKLTTADGTIEAKKSVNKIIAQTTTGDIVITNHGSVEATSDKGSVQVQPMYAGWGEMKVKSGEGGATAFIPDEENLKLEVTGATEITSEFTLEGDLPGPLKMERGTADNQILIQASGPVKIFKTVKAEQGRRGSMYDNRWKRDQTGLRN